MYAYGGAILHIDLGSGCIRKERFDEAFARTYLGGNGFTARTILERCRLPVDPLGPENVLVFAVGPFANTPIWGSSRCHVSAISPQTGFFADSNFGGDFGRMLKRTGYDAVAITGKSEVPAYLLVTEESAKIEKADDVWGSTTFEAIELIRRREGKSVVPAVIGPAGENGVRFASIVGAGMRHGTAGRCGMGAVMGAKRLKAVVAGGNAGANLFDPEGLADYLRDHRKEFRENTAWFTQHGTPMLVETINALGLLGTYNNAAERFDGAESIGAEALDSGFVKGNTACHGCPVACGKKGILPDAGSDSGTARGPERLPASVKLPEYETLYALGSMIDNADLSSIVELNALCDAYGLDTISMGVTLAFAAECNEQGVVAPSEIGAEIRFGDGLKAKELARQTALKRGPGAALAEGSARMAERIGGDAGKLLHAVKGLEIAGHSARGLKSLALGYATSTRGGSHHDTRPDYSRLQKEYSLSEEAAYNVKSQNFSAVGDSLIICRFVGERGFGDGYHAAMAELLQFLTGWDVSVEELETIGERIYTSERVISLRCGLRGPDIALSHRILHEPIPGGPAEGRLCPESDLQTMLNRYYQLRKWSPDGVPSEQRLRELDIVIDGGER